MGTRFKLCSLLLLALAILSPAVWAEESTTGAIGGNTVDKQGAGLPGVSVTLTSVQGSKTEATDSGGRFRFEYLTPGAYKLTAALSGFITVERQNIDVRLGARVRMEITMTEGLSETIDVIGTAPVVDLSSTTSGATISSELMASVPVGRTFGETLALAPGVVDSGVDTTNPSIGGASGLDNMYVVDGVNIGNSGYGSAGSFSIVYGSLGSGVNFDYIQEVQVKTGGYEPEFGEALGGFVNLITKSGGNDLKGSGYAYYAPEWAEGSREELTLERVDDVSSDNSTRKLTNTDVGIEAGGPMVKDKAFVYGAFNPSFEKFNRRTYHVVRDSQGIDHTLDRKRKTYNYAGNARFFPTPRHTLSFSAFGDPAKGDSGAQNATTVKIANPEARFSEFKYGGHNVIGKWNGELMSNWFLESALGWHKDEFIETPTLNQANGSDRRVLPIVAVGGLGFLGNTESRNTQFRVKMSNFFTAGGEHNLRYGVEYNKVGYDAATGYSGPAGAVVTPDGLVSTTGFLYRILNPSVAFPFPVFQVFRTRFNDELALKTKSDYTSFFVSDSWNVTKQLNIMAGIRYDRDHLEGDGVAKSQMTWSDNWGPRFHATFDPTGDNKTKLGFSWGRFFGRIPNDLAYRAMSEEVSASLRYRLSDWDISDINNPRQVPGAVPVQQITIGSSPTVVCGQTAVPGISDAEIIALCNGKKSKISFQDEMIISAEREIMPFFNFGASFTRRNLGRTLEDFAIHSYSALIAGTEDFGNYIIGNPNESYPDFFPKPTREYNAFTLRADKRMHNNYQVLASYTYARLRGNYEGAYRRDNGQSDPFISSLYDFAYLRDPGVFGDTIANGALPNDRAHVFNLYGSYLWNNKLNIGLGFKVQSGLPITQLGFNEVYLNGGEIVLGPRGSGGRGDVVTNFDLHLDYPLNVGSGKIALIVDVFNLFNLQQGLEYQNDLEIGDTIANCGEDCRNPDFGKILTFQDPRQIRFAARYSF